MSAARMRLAKAVRAHSRRVHDASSREAHYAIVRSADPILVEVVDRRLLLDENDLIVSQWVRRYDYDHGLVVGDTVLILHMPNDDFLLCDVVTDRPIEAGLNEETRTTVSHPSRNGTIVGQVPYLDELGAVVGYVPIYDSLLDDPGGVTIPVVVDVD